MTTYVDTGKSHTSHYPSGAELHQSIAADRSGRSQVQCQSDGFIHCLQEAPEPRLSHLGRRFTEMAEPPRHRFSCIYLGIAAYTRDTGHTPGTYGKGSTHICKKTSDMVTLRKSHLPSRGHWSQRSNESALSLCEAPGSWLTIKAPLAWGFL